MHCAPALLAGTPVEGTWFDRKLEYNSRLRGKEPGPRELASSETVKLSQLPAGATFRRRRTAPSCRDRPEDRGDCRGGASGVRDRPPWSGGCQGSESGDPSFNLWVESLEARSPRGSRGLAGRLLNVKPMSVQPLRPDFLLGRDKEKRALPRACKPFLERCAPLEPQLGGAFPEDH